MQIVYLWRFTITMFNGIRRGFEEKVDSNEWRQKAAGTDNIYPWPWIETPEFGMSLQMRFTIYWRLLICMLSVVVGINIQIFNNISPNDKLSTDRAMKNCRYSSNWYLFLFVCKFHAIFALFIHSNFRRNTFSVVL